MIKLGGKNHCIIASESVGGICMSSAVMRTLNIDGNSSVQVWFTQASLVDKFDVSKLKPGSLVTFVDLGVNFKDEQMTLSLVQKILDAGHIILAIVSGYDNGAWKRIIDQTLLHFDLLLIKPALEDNTNSNSEYALSVAYLNDHVDNRVVELCKAADCANRMDFSSRFASMVNQAIKSHASLNQRKKYLVHHLAQGEVTADDIIAGWINEYDEILSTHEKLKKDSICITKGLIRVDASNEIIDVSVLLSDLYAMGAKVAIICSDIFNPIRGYKFPKVIIATCDKTVDVLSIIKTKVPSASGIASKAYMDPMFEQEAIGAVLESLVAV